MDKKRVVQKALDAGFLVSPEEIEKLTEENIDEMIKKSKDTFVDSKQTTIPKEIEVNIRKEKTKKKITIQDFIKYYNKIYEALRDVLLKKTDATSINKISNISSEVTVIGMLKDTIPQGFVLEDPTGNIEVVSNEVPEFNSVVAVTGVVRENRLFKKNIIYPEIPLPKNIPKIDAKLLLTTEENFDGHDVVLNLTKEKKDKNTFKMTHNPTWMDIRKDQTTIKVFVYKTNVPVDENEINNYLKMRMLPSKHNTPNINVLLDEIPDIIWIIQNKEWKKNYKGITIISSNTSTSIDLNTREVKFV